MPLIDALDLHDLTAVYGEFFCWQKKNIKISGQVLMVVGETTICN
jgi:hypothetical protein